ncbi:hypothetical protein Tco_0987358 [Tanacetum coccineum]
MPSLNAQPLYASPIEQLWQTAALVQMRMEVREITYTIDRNIKTYNAALTKLIKRVKKLEQTIKTSQARERAKVSPPHAADQGRFDDTQISDQPKEQLGVFSAATTLVDAARRRRSVENVQTYIRRRRELDEREEVAAKVDEAHDIDWSDPDVLRYHTLKITFSVARSKEEHVSATEESGGYKMSHFKGMSYEDIRPIFERVWDQNHAFIPMGSEIKKEVMKKSRFDLQQESSKPVKEEIARCAGIVQIGQGKISDSKYVSAAYVYVSAVNEDKKDSVMSNSDESGVTYTEVSSPFEGLSDIGSPRADDHEYLELLGMPEDPYVEAALQAPPSLDYVPGAEEPEQAPPSPDYVLGPRLLNDGDKEIDGGDEDEPSQEDEDDDVDIEADEDKEEEEHPAPADSVVVALPAADQAPSAEETEPFKTDESAATPPPHLAYCVTARISIPAPVPTPVWSDAEVARLLAISTPPSSHSPCPIRSLGYRAAMIRLRAEAASTSHSLPLPPPFILSPTRSDAPSSGIPPPLPISVPTSSPPLLLPFASHSKDRPKVTLPPQKRLGITLGPRYEVGESSSAAAARPAGGLRADYGFVATMDREIRRDPEREVGYGITDSWDEIVETLQDKDEIYTRLDDEQSQRQLLVSRLNMLFRARWAHAYTRHLIETEARLSREAWRQWMDASDLARGEVMSLRTTVLGQMSEIRELHAADRRRQAVTSEMLKADHRRSAKMRELRTTDRTRQ